ncbi:MAG: protein translocase subunit SecD [Burkholderiaceae bacterium]
MNRFPAWKYALIAIVLLLGLIYALPNVFGEAPAIQISSAKTSQPIDAAVQAKVEQALLAAGLKAESVMLEKLSIKAAFSSADDQRKARDAVQKALVPDPGDPAFVVAFNLLPRSPSWLTGLGANPMYLGLDLRGGVHFLLQVDMKSATQKKVEALNGEIRTSLREKNIRHGGVSRNQQSIEIKARDAATAKAAADLLAEQFADLQVTTVAEGTEYKVSAQLKAEALRQVQELALKQNITTLNNRVNALGVAEPVIQQQGADRIVVQLPGVQDTAEAKNILGRTAVLEVRLVDESAEGRLAESNAAAVPFGSERHPDRNGQFVITKKQVILTGENLTDAQPNFDSQTQEPVVNLSLDAKGSRIFRDVTRENINKRMAILLFEKNRGEVVTAPVIRTEIAGGRVQISGRMTTKEASDIALLLRSGSLAAPMEIIEERTVGPTLGAENIEKGFNSVTWGFAAIMFAMCAYYMLFGLFSSLALGVNLLLLLAVLSMIQATLTLPGIAAIALTLGMAIDSNVLINERVREELRNGAAPQQAIHNGYTQAWATILDSNITTLIAGLALLVFGSGPVRGFAVVHCIGILTSMFSAVLFSRGLVNLWYGRQKKLKSISVGTVWRPEAAAATEGALPVQLDATPPSKAAKLAAGKAGPALAGKSVAKAMAK